MKDRGEHETSTIQTDTVHVETALRIRPGRDVSKAASALQGARDLYRQVRGYAMRRVSYQGSSKPYPLHKIIQDVMGRETAEHTLSEELAALCHKHLSLLARELIPEIANKELRCQLSQAYGSAYKCLDDADRIRARNLAYDIIKAIRELGMP